MAFCPTSSPLADHPDSDTARYGIEMLERKHDAPFFLALGFIKPHLAFVCPEKFFDLHAGPITPPRIKPDDLADLPWVARSNAKLGDDMNYRQDGRWEKVRRAYLACISWTDSNIGLVLDALAASPHADNTIVVLWSDHGYHLGEKRSFRKFTLWEEATRVPFIIHDPRIKTDYKSCPEADSLIDIFPTLCELTGVPTPDDLDGESLVPWLADPGRAKRRPAIITWGRGNYSVRNRNWRYNRYFDSSEELYDHKNDPDEWHNLAGNKDYAAKKKHLAKFLPQNEAPLVLEAKALHNVVDADQPSLEGFKKLWKRAKQKLDPPLE
jgi:arylsulfatase A-like enzyme